MALLSVSTQGGSPEGPNFGGSILPCGSSADTETWTSGLGSSTESTEFEVYTHINPIIQQHCHIIPPKKKKNYKHFKSQRIFNIQSQKQINKTTNFFFLTVK